ncbi:hypothetical protein P152DRAFT_473969 [Eremomyces bilateralis CBS 781.70]|uniref:DNA replication checkpoint mediator MRC1 domain-containing protein n=1 Tax=Eremomyces bilateralis CBS 781.70 TaxID=1392243 RepID=A0A6G1G2B9_9PEZI|nr:uncharacterized protein P152DRAFT_473969 [Eremomyces bilateralis CBS 781.70]KAF1812257.1 hypothetical protein P152DRAFT_473969 [Eremomyces bilateralis CBS 781.70]
MADSRPTRKASKKALEEMARETQRLTRSTQLTHQARTKKRFPVADLLKRFNYRSGAQELTSPAENDEPSPEADQPFSDQEHRGADVETPPTSPAAAPVSSHRAKDSQHDEPPKLPFDPLYDESDDELPTLNEALARASENKPVNESKADSRPSDGLGTTKFTSLSRNNKSVGRKFTFSRAADKAQTGSSLLQRQPHSDLQSSTARAHKRIMDRSSLAHDTLSDSDDDLEIIRPHRSHLPIFDDIPSAKATEPDSLRVLRTLAHIHSPSKSKRSPIHMTASELQTSLQRRAKAQAENERQERIEALKAKGIVVQTDEEREKEQLELDNLLEKARRDAATLAKKEKVHRKPGEDELPSSDEDDEFEASAEEDEDLELSGSEDDDASDADESIAGILVDNEADDSDEDSQADGFIFASHIKSHESNTIEGMKNDAHEMREEYGSNLVTGKLQSCAPHQTDKSCTSNLHTQTHEGEGGSVLPSSAETSRLSTGMPRPFLSHTRTDDGKVSEEDLDRTTRSERTHDFEVGEEDSGRISCSKTGQSKHCDPHHPSRLSRKRRIILDDDDMEDSDLVSDSKIPLPAHSHAHSPAASDLEQPHSTNQEDSLAAAFGISDTATDSLPGLTQLFAGTMADSSQEEAPQGNADDLQEDSLDFLRAIPSTLPSFDNLVFGSQNHATQHMQPDHSQSHPTRSQPLDLGITQLASQEPSQFLSQSNMSDFPNPTPDAGFQFSHSPIGAPPLPHSTISTVPVQDPESPVQRRGRLQRREHLSNSPSTQVNSESKSLDDVLEVPGENGLGSQSPTTAAGPLRMIHFSSRRSSRSDGSGRVPVHRSGRNPGEKPPIGRRAADATRQRSHHEVVFSDEDENDEGIVGLAGNEEVEHLDAFKILKKRSVKRAEQSFDKKKSGAKNMVDEQAEESEDEYAGLGGASDDDSTGEVDEEMQKMIDESHIDVNERELAALYAGKARADEEKLLQKLYKDINTGGLRRKRDGLDLSDSEDEAVEQRRRKQRDFAKMRKALLEDENIQTIASNPKREAFLRTLEDHDEDLGTFTVTEEPADMALDSQTQDSQDFQDHPGANSTRLQSPTDHAAGDKVNSLKRSRDSNDEQETRPPPALRRTANPIRKPTTIADIRENVSFLIGEDDSQTIIPYSQESESETEESHTFTRVDTDSSSQSYRDRYSAHRATTSASNTSHKSAFVTSSQTDRSTTFKPPTLLRRVTARTNSTDSGSGTGVTTRVSTSGGSSESSVRIGGTKKANIHHQAREAERRAAIEKATSSGSVVMKKKKTAQKKSGLGALLGGNGFE